MHPSLKTTVSCITLFFLSVPCSIAQEAKPEGKTKSGLFGFLDKITKPGGFAETYIDTRGREYKLKNFKFVSKEDGAKFQQAMDEKNGFRNYKFGISPEEFAKIAKDNKEIVKGMVNKDVDFVDISWVESRVNQFVNNVPVIINYGFYKGALATVHVEALTTQIKNKTATALYNAVADAFGPGLILRKQKTEQFEEKYAGVVWFSEKIEIVFNGTYNPSERPKPLTRFESPSADIMDDRGDIYFNSKELMKEYSTKFKAKAKSGI